MAFEGIKDTLTEQFKSISSRVRDTDQFQQLSEKYHGLSPAGQKASLFGAIAVAALIVLAIPYSIYAGSQSSIEDYQNKRDLIRELFKVNREASALPPAPPAISSGDLTNQARSQLQAQRLAPEQIVGVSETPLKVPGIATTIEQAAIQISLAKLNLKQIVDIGVAMQSLQTSARMMGLDIKANAADTRYYDVIFKVVAFSAKPEAAPAGGKGKKK